MTSQEWAAPVLTVPRETGSLGARVTMRRPSPAQLSRRSGGECGFQRGEGRGSILGFRGRFPVLNLLDGPVRPGSLRTCGLEDESRCEDVDVRPVGKRLVSVEIGAEDRRGCVPAGGRVVAKMAEVLE
jgi:hypothetical protein